MRAGEPGDISAPIIEPLFPGDVLPTVSRRDKNLHKVRLWTSGNRVFGCRGEVAIRLIAGALAAGADPLGTVRDGLGSVLGKKYARCVDAAAVKLDQIARNEDRELSDWKRGLTHDVVELAS